jgi:hypothetical protein
MATQEAPTRSRSRFVPPTADLIPPTDIRVLENPITLQNPALGRAAEQEIGHALQDEHLGTLHVRFRVCRDEDEGLRFVCKVENPPAIPIEGSLPVWRWWSPLLSSAEELRAALAEGLQVRRQRLVSSSRYPA